MSESTTETQTMPVAEIVGKSKHFLTMFAGAASTVDTDISMIVGPEGLKAQALASDKAGLAVLDYPSYAFDTYNVNTTTAFSVKGDEVVNVVKRAGKKNATIAMSIDFANSRLNFKFDGRAFKCRLVEAKVEIKPITLTPTCLIVAPFTEWQDLLADLTLEDKSSKNAPKMLVQVKDGKARFWKENPSGTEYETVKENTPAPAEGAPESNGWKVSGECDVTEFNTEKLSTISKALAPTAEKVAVNIASGQALRLDFDEGYTSYWLGAIVDRKS